jgi:hypothetical protein
MSGTGTGGRAPIKGLATANARKNAPNCSAGGMLGRLMEGKRKRKERNEKLVEIRSAARTLRKEADCLDYTILQLVEQAKAKRKMVKNLSAEADALSAEADAEEGVDESDGGDE